MHVRLPAFSQLEGERMSKLRAKFVQEVGQRARAAIGETASEPIVGNRKRDHKTVGDQVDAFNARFAEIGNPEIVARVSVEEVSIASGRDWPEQDIDNGPGFVFEVVGNDIQRATLLSAMKKAADPKERWKYESWINEGAEPCGSRCLFTVRRENETTPAGFMTIDTSFDLDDGGFDLGNFTSLSDPELDLYFMLSMTVENVYVSPAKRGQGYASAFRFAVAHHAYLVLEKIAAIDEDTRTALGNPRLRFFFDGEAHSYGGALVGCSLAEELEYALVEHQEDGAWFQDTEFENNFDDDDWIARHERAEAKAALRPVR
jgi:GNAT superfamily N-acetyltransferase